MGSKAPRERHARHAAADARPQWVTLLQTVVLGGAVALLIVATLIPSESTVSDGTYAPVAAVWCLLLLLWSAAAWLGRQPVLRPGWTEKVGGLLVGWHSLAALVSLGHVNGRQALNSLWLFVGYGLTVFLLRQCLRTVAQARAIVVVMIWLATLLASLGLYQYGYRMPALRRQYEANPEQVLAENGISTDKNSPQRELFENRVRSVEPLATFALTNSLAGYLAPWLIATLGIALAVLGDKQQRRTLIALAAIAIVLAGCLVLTKSRTAYLATLVGVVLVALYGRHSGWRLDWRIPTAIAGVLIVIGMAAVYFGGLDAKVLSEAPKSVLYRLEYWQATAALIADRPLLGCGPGNFQEAYTAYKLPQASETVADPHNFFLEMWATAGTPGIILLIVWMAAFVVELATLAHSSPVEGIRRATPQRLSTLTPAISQGEREQIRTIFGGALAGLILAAPLAWLADYPLDPVARMLPLLPVAWLIGIPLLAAWWWLFEPWIAEGELPLIAAIAPLVVLLVNLLAAGALVFPGVMGTLLVLVPVALVVARPEGGRAGDASAVESPSKAPLTRAAGGLIALAAAILTLACMRTEYQPVLNSRLRVSQALDALSRGDVPAAETSALAAAAADTFSPEPWRLVAELRLQRWLTTSEEDDRQAFVVAADELRRLSPRHHAALYTRGNWFLTAWKKQGRGEDLNEAINAYTRAIMCYPKRALYHAQLAWTLHLAGKVDLASQEAEEAKQLDDLMPHRDQKLGRQRIFDPQMTAASVAAMERPESAEQTVERLRTTHEEKSL